MTILITGVCGFVGSTLARALLDASSDIRIIGVDNLCRAGSERNRTELARRGVRTMHGDVRMPSDVEPLPAADCVLDTAANPSVLAGVDGRTSSRQLVEHNLIGTLNTLEYCKTHGAGFILMSTSRVYSTRALNAIPLAVKNEAFEPVEPEQWPGGFSDRGVAERFSTDPPISLYGATKLAAEKLALEYGESFGFPVWVNRCGVLAGAGQFAHGEQGIIGYWLHAWRQRRPLRYIGFGGLGHQVRDVLHPRDLAGVILRQARGPAWSGPRVLNLGGGPGNAISLAKLTHWCSQRFGSHGVGASDHSRAYDVPWLVLDCAAANAHWGWCPATPLDAILEEIADFAEAHPRWLEETSPANP